MQAIFITVKVKIENNSIQIYFLLPLLLSKEGLKETATSFGFKKDTVKILWQRQPKLCISMPYHIIFKAKLPNATDKKKLARKYTYSICSTSHK